MYSLNSYYNLKMKYENKVEMPYRHIFIWSVPIFRESNRLNALKILSMRLRGTEAKQLEDMGEDTNGLITSTSKLRDTILSLSGVDIMLDDKSFKST